MKRFQGFTELSGPAEGANEERGVGDEYMYMNVFCVLCELLCHDIPLRLFDESYDSSSREVDSRMRW